MTPHRAILATALALPLTLTLSAWTVPPSSGLSSDLSSTVPTVDPAANLPQTFDLQSHRFGRGEWTEESALGLVESQKLDVTTLEFDIVISADGVPVVWHDPVIQADKCTDTSPVGGDDPDFPYVGDLVRDLTWAQLQTLNCNLPLPGHPDAVHPETNQLLQLRDVFELTRDDDAVHYNIETKIEGEDRERSATPEQFVDAILPVIEEYGVSGRTMIQSFDWRSLPLVRAQAPEIPLVLLWDESTWFEGSPWIGEVDHAAVDGDIIAAARQLDVQVLSPGYAQPYGANAGDADYHPVATPEFIAAAHANGLMVVPWTINDESTMREQIEAGVDGIITDYPSRLAAVLDELGIGY